MESPKDFCVAVIFITLILLTAISLGQVVPSTQPTSAALSAQAFVGTFDQLAAEMARDREWGYKRDDPDHTSMPKLVMSLRGVTDNQLESLLGNAPTNVTDTTYLDLCLTEIVRRGGPHWEKVLTDRYAAALVADKNSRVSNLEEGVQPLLLTALCRVQGKDDPLRVLVSGKAQVRCRIADLPTITANITNLDPAKRAVSVVLSPTISARFRFHLIDPDGKVIRQTFDFPTDGLVRESTIGYGESVPVDLRLDDYVVIDRPGTYQMEVLYHPVDEIAFGSTIDGLLCCKSIPMTLEVKPRLIASTPREQIRVAELIRSLPTAGRVRVLGGQFDKAMNDFVPNDSPAGQLKQLGWNAVPELLAAANDDRLNPVQRAWVLGLLYGITNQHSPVEDFWVLGNFDYRDANWYSPLHQFGRDHDRDATITANVDIDEAAQKTFAKVWQSWIVNRCVRIIAPR